MGRNLLLLFLRQFLLLLVRGIGFAAMMLAVTLFGILRGVWQQSDYVANAWRSQLVFARMDSHFDGPMYWSIRIFALVAMIACLVVLAHLLTWLFEQALPL